MKFFINNILCYLYVQFLKRYFFSIAKNNSMGTSQSNKEEQIYIELLDQQRIIEESSNFQQEKNLKENHSVVEFEISQKQKCMELIKYAGDQGRYQNISLVIWCLVWYIAGVILQGVAFLIYNPPYECQGMSSETCTKFVCSLGRGERLQYLPKDKILTLANSFGDFHCNPNLLMTAASLVYLGSFFGTLVGSFIVDNIGRKMTMLFTCGTTLFGIILVSLASNLQVACFGLFFQGFGINSSIFLCFYFITQSVGTQIRENHSVIVQFFFALGGLLNVAYYYWFRNWNIIHVFFLLIPAVVIFLFLLLVIEETPFFLVKKYSLDYSLKALNKIARLNRKPFKQVIAAKMITSLKKQLSSEDQLKKQTNITLLDLVRYPSIRWLSMSAIFVCAVIFLDYYGFLLLMDKFGFSIYLNGIVVISSEIIVFPIFYYIIKTMRRKKAVLISITFATISCGILALIEGREGFLAVIQLSVAFIFRFAVSFQYAIVVIHLNEIFPTQIRGMAVGFACAMAIGFSGLLPFFIQFVQSTKITIMILTLLTFISGLVYLTYPETLGKDLEDQIEELKVKK